MIEMTEAEFDKKLAEYRATFNDQFPTFVLAFLGYDEMSAMIDSCIAAGKDAYDIGYLTLDESIKY